MGEKKIKYIAHVLSSGIWQIWNLNHVILPLKPLSCARGGLKRKVLIIHFTICTKKVCILTVSRVNE